MKPIFRGKIINGRFIPYRQTEYIVHIAKLEGAEVDHTLEIHRNNRSNRQNAYFHGPVLEIISGTTGYTTSEVKEILKGMFLKEYRTIKTKHTSIEVEIIRPTSSLNTKEFEQFLTNIREWASSELGIYIPEPNEVMF